MSGPGADAAVRRSATFVLFYPDFIPRHRLMARSLADAGWEVRVVCWDRGTAAGAVDARSWLAARHAVRIPAGAGSLTLLAKLPFLFAGMLRTLRGESAPDALFLTHYCLLPLAPFLRRRCRVLFYDAPDYYCEDLARYFGPLAPLVRPVLRFVERALVGFADAVLTIDSHRGWLADYYRRMRRPVQVVWNVPALADDPAPEEIAAARAELGGGPIIAYVGGIKPDKGLETMLSAIAPLRVRFPRATFLFIGPVQRRTPALDGRLRSLEVQGAARFLPPLPYRQMMARLRASAVGLAVLARGRNDLAGAGNCRKVFTYMQGGLPIVATEVGSIGAFVREQNCGSAVNPDRVEEAIEAIARCLADPATAKTQGERGRRAFEERFNWESQSAAFLGFVAGASRAEAA